MTIHQFHSGEKTAVMGDSGGMNLQDQLTTRV
jgi:hypothetical protein